MRIVKDIKEKTKKPHKKHKFLRILVFIVLCSILVLNYETVAVLKRSTLNYINTNMLDKYNVYNYKASLLPNITHDELKTQIKKENSKINLKNITRKSIDCLRDNSYEIDEFLNCWEDSIQIPNLGISIEGCTSMVPQGICFAKNYILISQYCKCSERHESLICVLDKKTGKYIKTLILQDERIHAGGITYNEKENQVVVTADAIDDESLIYYYSFDDVLKASDGDYLTINYIKKIPLDETSFITYNKNLNEMYIGFFTKSVYNGKIYTLDSRNTYNYLDAYMQGCCFYKNYILFSYSYGISNSRIEIKTINEDGSINNYDKAYEISCPPYLEEIIIDEDTGTLYCLFESGAASYRTGTNLVIDRIAILDINDILNNLEK